MPFLLKHNRPLEALRRAFAVPGNESQAAIAQLLDEKISFIYPGVGGLQFTRTATSGSGAAGVTTATASPSIAEGMLWWVRACSAFHDDAAAAATITIFHNSMPLSNPIALVTGQSVTVNQHIAVGRPFVIYPGESISAVISTAGFGVGSILAVRVAAFLLPDSVILPTL